MTHNILSGIRIGRGRSAPAALIRQAIFKKIVQYIRNGYVMKALGPNISESNFDVFSARFEELNKADL